MPLDPLVAKTLPATLQTHFENWLHELQAALGTDLVSLVVYGGLARGSFDPDSSDINLMAVVQTATPALLERCSSLVRRGVRDFRAGLFLITEEELRQSTDVFPVKFLDLQRQHRLLAGRDVLSGLPISRTHLRLRCEQELRDLVLNLRRVYLRQGHHPEILATWLRRAVSSLLVNAAVLCELQTGRPAPDRNSLVDTMQGIGLPADPVREALALRQGTQQPTADELRQIYVRFLSVLERAVQIADQLEKAP